MSTTRSEREHESYERRVLAKGISYFAAGTLALTGAFQVLAGITAIAEDEIFVVGTEYVFGLDVTLWGWIHLMIGVVAIATAVGIFTNNAWAITAGIVIVLLSALSNFAFLPYYPLWSVVVIALNVLVLWALCQRLEQTD